MRDQPDWWREMESNPIRPSCQTMSNWRARIDLQCSKLQSAIATTTKIIEAGGLGLQPACLASDGLSSFRKAGVVFRPPRGRTSATWPMPRLPSLINKSTLLKSFASGNKKTPVGTNQPGFIRSGRLGYRAFRNIRKTLRS